MNCIPVFDTIRELTISKNNETTTNTSMSENKSSETNYFMSAHGNNTGNKSETRILFQEEVDEQIRNYIALLTRQPEVLTRLSQGMSTAHRPNLSPRVGTSASPCTTDPSFDSTIHYFHASSTSFSSFIPVQCLFVEYCLLKVLGL